MRKFLVLSLVLLGVASPDLSAQRGRGGSGRASFAVVVTDSAGTPISNVLVTLEGQSVTRSARTEAGRIAFEGLPTGTYKFRFEREGFVTLERDVTARSSTPVDVKVALEPVPPPPPPPAPVAPPPPPPSAAKPAVLDVPSVIEKNYIGRSAGKSLTLACAGSGAATLIQLNDPLTDESHANADEFLYTIAGEGTVKMDGRQERIKAGVLVLIPRGVKHTLTVTGRSPLVLVATRAGEGCADRRP